MSTPYGLAYRLGITPWERAAKVAEASRDVLFAREEAERPRPPGRALDLGCGRGVHTHALATRGWQAVGVDSVPRAVAMARDSGASGATFVIGDVTDLSAADLGTFDFFFDVGCCHGLSVAQRRSMAAGVSALANPGATLLMVAFQPNRVPFVPAGLTRADVEAAFSDWDVVSVEPADASGMPAPLRRTAPQWYRLRLRP